MIDYKKIFRSRELREKILGLLSWVPDKQMLELQYRIKTGRKLNLKDPKRFTEKLQWYKLYYRDPLMTQCVDKYEVRKYVKSKGLGHILNKCYGVYDRVEDIDFDALPEQFVLKKTNGGGGLNVIICKSKYKFNIDDARGHLLEWLKPMRDKGLGREWAYDGLASRIIIDRYLENNECPEAGITDYKFICYHGDVKFVVVDKDRYIDEYVARDLTVASLRIDTCDAGI